MLAGELYNSASPEIQADQRAAAAWLVRYNAALGMAPAERRGLLVERFAAVGEGVDIRPPFPLRLRLQHHPSATACS